MALRSASQLAADFPTTSEYATLQSLALMEQLIRDGQLTTPEAAQVLDAAGKFFDTNAEVYKAGPASYHGTAGSTTRFYGVVPRYAMISPPPGNAGNFAGKYLTQLPGQPAEGRGQPGGGVITVADNAKNFYYGLSSLSPSNLVSVANTAATLTPTSFMSIGTPAQSTLAASSVANVTYDVVVCNSIGSITAGLATAVAPSTFVLDKGTTFPYTPVSHSEVAKGPVSGLLIFGSTTTVPPRSD